MAASKPTRTEGSTVKPIIVNQHLTKSTFAYHEMRRMILEGEIEPGTRLLLRDIADRLGLSIQPIRDAIKMLAARPGAPVALRGIIPGGGSPCS